MEVFVMNAKELKNLVKLKDVQKIIATIVENGWQEAKHCENLGEISLVDLFKTTEVCSSPRVKIAVDEYLYLTIYEEVPYAEKWTWMIIFHDKRFGLGMMPKDMRIYVKRRNENI